ncbi:MAG: transposase [Clostridiaceae bacterium]
MSNKEREWFPDTSYHITIRGNRRSDIFKDDEDFQMYLDIIREALEYYDDKFEIICYCLMDNHVHILLKTKDMHMKFFMARISGIYTKYFNDKHNFIGHLYQDRYFSELIETDTQMLETSRYIHLNPIRANMVKKPEDYNWSSYSMYIGKKREKLINSSEILSYFINGNERDLYKKFVEQGIKIKLNQEDKL